MKQRLQKELKKLLIIFISGVTYYILFYFFKIGIPCIFNKLTGLLCPACGATRMADRIFHMDFKSAYSYNKALFLLLPVVFIILIYEEFQYIKSGNRSFAKLSTVILYVLISLLLIFGVIRNLI